MRRNSNLIVLKIINALANLYKISLVENLNTKEFQDQLISESQRFFAGVAEGAVRRFR